MEHLEGERPGETVGRPRRIEAFMIPDWITLPRRSLRAPARRRTASVRRGRITFGSIAAIRLVR